MNVTPNQPFVVGGLFVLPPVLYNLSEKYTFLCLWQIVMYRLSTTFLLGQSLHLSLLDCSL